MNRPYRKCPEKEAKRYALAAEMHALHKDGLTIGEVAANYGMTNTAIVQRFHKWGLPIFGKSNPLGGSGLLLARRVAARKARVEEHARQKWGCSHAEYLALRCKPMRTFQAQRNNAHKRGIGWELTLWQWWTIWQESGHWEARGRGDGYVMCRKGDLGPYRPDNVYIATGSQNIRDGYEFRAKLRLAA